MNLSTSSTLILLIILVFFSLAVVSVINERERRSQLIQRRLEKIRQRANQLEVLIMEIESLLPTRDVPRVINDAIIQMLAPVRDKEKNSSYLEAAYRSAVARQDTLDTAQNHYIDRMRNSDRKIAMAQQHLQEAGHIIREQQLKGRITHEEMQAFIDELSWAHIMVEVVSYLAQGHRAMERPDILNAHAFYKRAQQVLIRSNHPNPHRKLLIREITDVMLNKRTQFSPDIVHELGESYSATSDDLDLEAEEFELS